MQLAASSPSDVLEALAAAGALGERITSFDLHGMRRVVEYTPEDMTVTAEAGITLADLQTHLADRGQWLPIDPPRADTLTLGALLAGNRSGPRRFGYGTIRDYLLGITVALTDGRVIKAGGKVVKNVAGYDLCKLFVGSRGTLGVIIEATFKVLPLPETEQFLGARAESLQHIARSLEAVDSSPLTPVILDSFGDAGSHSLVLGFAGPREDVAWQVEHARQLGFSELSSLAHETRFWSLPDAPHRASVLPSRLAQVLGEVAPESYVARAGNGVIYYRGGKAPIPGRWPEPLTRQIKDAYDPKHLLPEMSW